MCKSLEEVYKAVAEREDAKKCAALQAKVNKYQETHDVDAERDMRQEMEAEARAARLAHFSPEYNDTRHVWDF